MDEHRGASYLYAVGSTDLGEDLQKFEYSASRIETRSRYASLDTLPQYTPEVQAELFARFERGEPLPEWTAENNPWHRLVAHHCAAGGEMRRVHLVGEPLSAFKRFELATQLANLTVGEDIRVAPLQQVRPIGMITYDFWTFDGRYALVLGYDSADNLTDTNDAEDSGPYRRWLSHVYEAGIPLAEYQL